MMEIVYLGLGSNLGNREENLESALQFISGLEDTKFLLSSKIQETFPWGYEQQPLFLNMALKIATYLKPFELLYRIKQGEKLLGRKENFRWGPRLVDIDILLFGQLIIKTDELTIPHPRIKERLFILESLVEIDDELVDPQNGVLYRNLIESFVKE